MASFNVPGLSPEAAEKVRSRLQERLVSLIDLQLTLKHIHWNVVGPTFIGVHQMLDPQVDATRLMSDALAERIAALGGEPQGTPGYVVSHRSWEDYSLRRDSTLAHLGALDLVYAGVIIDHREALEEFDDLDLVSQDMLIEQTEQLEQFQWFVRAHLEDSGGKLSNAGADSEKAAAKSSGRKAPAKSSKK